MLPPSKSDERGRCSTALISRLKLLRSVSNTDFPPDGAQGASLTPSPVMPVTRPPTWQVLHHENICPLDTSLQGHLRPRIDRHSSLGMPFSKGADKAGDMIDWCFSINGAASGMGSASAVRLSIHFGFGTPCNGRRCRLLPGSFDGGADISGRFDRPHRQPSFCRHNIRVLPCDQHS